jgi:phosphoglycolate phosphatase-like HAD superfamily hydrolase
LHYLHLIPNPANHASLPQTYMFVEMRSVLGIPKGNDILAHVAALPASEQEPAMEKIRAIEQTAMAAQTPQPGLLNLMKYLESKSIPKGICTRNFDTPVNHLLDKFLAGQTFGPIVTRDFKPPKPDPAGILHIAKTWGFEDARDLIMVGCVAVNFGIYLSFNVGL